MLTGVVGVTGSGLDAPLAFYRAQGKIATVSVVRTPSNFCAPEIGENKRVTSFIEKPISGETLIYEGFSVVHHARSTTRSPRTITSSRIRETERARGLRRHE